MTKYSPRAFRLALLVIAGIALFGVVKVSNTTASNLSSVKVTMGNSRLSMRGQVSGTPGTNTTIDVGLDSTIDDYTNVSTLVTDTLKVTDTLTFTGATAGTRTIQSIIDGDTIIINSAIATTDETFYLQETSNLVASFNTVTSVAGGASNSRFELILPADPVNNNADGVPDQGYFDFGLAAPTVACTGTGYTFGTGTAASGKTNLDVGYENLPSGEWHVYRCPYTVSGAAPQAITMTIGTVGSNNGVINPVRIDSLNTGQADTYSVVVRNINTSDTVVDSTTVKIGAIEAVRVSATVVPSLTFEITGESSGVTRCGQTTSVATTASTVPFGEVGTGIFKDAAQKLKFTTNALSGAVVTAVANDQLGREGGACTGDLAPVYTLDPASGHHLCIWDANVASMSHTVEQAWTSVSNTGFGFSLENIVGAGAEFTYGTGFDARHFADEENSQAPEVIFSSTTPTNDHSVYACYRIVPDALTAAGDYYNYITYTATATF